MLKLQVAINCRDRSSNSILGKQHPTIYPTCCGGSWMRGCGQARHVFLSSTGSPDPGYISDDTSVYDLGRAGKILTLFRCNA